MKDKHATHPLRSEFGKITSVLIALFGFEQLEIVDHIMSEIRSEHSSDSIEPQTALYKSIENKIHHYSRGNSRQIRRDESIYWEELLSEQNIHDSQLKVIFGCCHPEFTKQDQQALLAHLVCGFHISEIALILHTSESDVQEGISIAKGKLKNSPFNLDMLAENKQIERLDQVTDTFYQLFNGAYYSECLSNIREELCLEILRLSQLIAQIETIDSSKINALTSWMLFLSSRINSPMGACGQVLLYDDEDTKHWNQRFISEGIECLNKASGDGISKYHLEANIAYWQTMKEDSNDKWKNIITLYDLLLIREKSSIAALNRTYAVYKLKNEEAVVKDSFKLELYKNQYYYVLLAELFKPKDREKTEVFLHKAYDLAQTAPERELISSKLNQLSA